jgi:hypothetical protein
VRAVVWGLRPAAVRCCAAAQEMSTPTPGRPLTQHRKAAVNFRDTALLKVFQV